MKSLTSQALLRYGDQVAWLLFAVVVSAACGLAISTRSLAIAAAIPAVALGAALIPLVRPGVLVGLALVLAANAVPGLDLTQLSLGEANGTDLAFLAILGFAVVRWFSAPRVEQPQTLSRLLGACSLLFLAVWSLAFVRALDAGTDYVHALSVGRDFLYFGLTLPFAGSLVRDEEELRQCCVVVGAVSVLFAGTYIVASLGLASSSIANAQRTYSQGHLTRIYNSGHYLFELTFSLSLAYALLYKGRPARLASFVAVITASALLLSLTRALYIGVLAALVLSFAIWGIGGGGAHRLLRRRLVLTVLVASISYAAFIVTVPDALTGGPLQSVIARASSTTSEFSSSDAATSDLAYRIRIDSLMLRTLGTHWPLGLGFLSPRTNYQADLPLGEIRNNDTGVFNSLMTIGVVGTVLLYLVPVSLLWALLLRARQPVQRNGYLLMGGMIWLLIVLITSYSLGNLASVSGLATTVVGIGILLPQLASHVTADGDISVNP